MFCRILQASGEGEIHFLFEFYGFYYNKWFRFLRDPIPNRENQDQQTLKLTNERFSIPELLFHPSDIGIEQVISFYRGNR